MTDAIPQQEPALYAPAGTSIPPISNAFCWEEFSLWQRGEYPSNALLARKPSPHALPPLPSVDPPLRQQMHTWRLKEAQALFLTPRRFHIYQLAVVAPAATPQGKGAE